MKSMLELEIIGEGATTKIYRDGCTAIKLYVNAASDYVDNEAECQRFAFNAGLPVPAVYGVRKIDENSVALDMEYINGIPLIHPGMDKYERKEAIRTLVKLQCMVHNVSASNLPKQSDILAWKINNTQFLDEPLKKDLVALLYQLNNNTDNLCHGDFHSLNILYDGSKHWIVDWMDATAGEPLADACRTYLVFKQYMVRSAGIYLRSFCEETKVKQDDILQWLPVIAAARLNENMEDKQRAQLLQIVNEWREK